MRDDHEFDGLYARLEDMKKRAIRGELGISAFLSPRELHYACAYLGTEGYITFGGYSDAERKRIYFLPDYTALPIGREAVQERTKVRLPR